MMWIGGVIRKLGIVVVIITLVMICANNMILTIGNHPRDTLWHLSVPASGDPIRAYTGQNVYIKATPMDAYYQYMNLSEHFAAQLNSNETFPYDEYFNLSRTVVNSWTFDTLYFNDTCYNRSRVVSVFLVISAPGNRDARARIRETWGGQATRTSQMCVIFVLGTSTNDSLNDVTYQETELYNDILLFDFLDTYENLTVKSIMSLRWTSNRFTNAKYIIKTDDDVLHNIKATSSILTKAHKQGIQGFGYGLAGQPVSRAGRWQLPHNQYPYDHFLHYLSGMAYAVSPAACQKLVATSTYLPLLRLEDVYVTGILAKMAGVKMIHMDGWLMNKLYPEQTNEALVAGNWSCAVYDNDTEWRQVYLDMVN